MNDDYDKSAFEELEEQPSSSLATDNDTSGMVMN